MGSDSQSWYLDLNHEQWVALPVDGPRPAARYKHAATVFEEKLYVMGGSRNGRYLSDLQVFDLKNLKWSSIKLNMEASADSKDSAKQGLFPATSGHSMIKWNGKLLLLAGLTKENSDGVVVRFIDLESYKCGVVETSGNIPVARSGQSVTLFGSKIIMFGGEDRNRRLLNDVHVLDLETMTWSVVETTQTPPSPRVDHTAALNAERYLFIFGGCSHSVFYNDLHVLDLETMEWSQPQLQGDLVAPRAGHAGVVVEGNWYIVGGGDSKTGALETLVINMSKLVVSVVTSVRGRDPLASEGISISFASVGGQNLLITFGGYNGKYYNEIYGLRVKPIDSLHPKILQSPAVLAKIEELSKELHSVQGQLIQERSRCDNLEAQIAELQKVLESLPSLEEEVRALRREKSALEHDVAVLKGPFRLMTEQNGPYCLMMEQNRPYSLVKWITDMNNKPLI